MKILRYRKGTQTWYGLLERDRIHRLSGTPFEGVSTSGEQDALAEADLLVPCRPSKIICLGLNYHDHAKEMGLAIPETPPLFMKPPTALPISLKINGSLCQQGNTRDLIFSIADTLVFVSGIMTLLPGDVILTGTPAGIGPMQAGDTVAVTIGGIGTLENTVASNA